MPLIVSFDPIRRAKPDALALPLFDDQPWPTFSALSAKDRAWLADWRKTKTFRPDRGQALLVHPTPKLPLLLLGLGAPKLLDAQAARLAGANLTRLAQRAGLSRVELVLPPQLNTPTLAHAFGQGAVLAGLRFDEFKSPSEPPASSRLRIEVHQSKWLAAAKQGALVSTSANVARRLAATPPNVAHPQAIADACRKRAREVGLRIKVITAPQLRRLGMNGLWSVGRAGSSEPCLIVLEHRGRPSKSQTDPVVLVGKAVTYDTGGYSLKTAEGQRGMKYDKCGGMAVLGALHAAATLKTPTPVVGLIAVAENMVDRRAYR
ncbi:MAG: hypothetical protein IT442_02420, partial [Phycisphaeraceae bacterium]|nr:hypothetical protein [Phycisphaeraceae bacterium]